VEDLAHVHGLAVCQAQAEIAFRGLPNGPCWCMEGQGARSRIGLSPTRGLKKGGDLRAPRQENKMAAPEWKSLIESAMQGRLPEPGCDGRAVRLGGWLAQTAQTIGTRRKSGNTQALT
jgi:hypothetical protein